AGQPAASALPEIQATLAVPRMLWKSGGGADIALADVQWHAERPLNDVRIDLRGSATQTPWRGQIDSAARLRLGAAGTPLATAWRDGRLDLRHLHLKASDSSRSDRVTDWTVQSTQPFALRWSLGPAGGSQALKLDAGAGRLSVLPAVRAVGAAAKGGLPT